MRSDLERLLRDSTLKTLLFAIAVGWSLFQAASGLALFITTLLQRFPSSDLNSFSGSEYGGLSWVVGHRVLVFQPLLQGLLELAAVLAVLVLVETRFASRRSSSSAPPESG